MFVKYIPKEFINTVQTKLDGADEVLKLIDISSGEFLDTLKNVIEGAALLEAKENYEMQEAQCAKGDSDRVN